MTPPPTTTPAPPQLMDPAHCPHGRYHAHVDVQGTPPATTAMLRIHCPACGAVYGFTGQVGLAPDKQTLAAQMAPPQTDPQLRTPLGPGIWTP